MLLWQMKTCDMTLKSSTRQRFNLTENICLVSEVTQWCWWSHIFSVRLFSVSRTRDILKKAKSNLQVSSGVLVSLATFQCSSWDRLRALRRWCICLLLLSCWVSSGEPAQDLPPPAFLSFSSLLLLFLFFFNSLSCWRYRPRCQQLFDAWSGERVRFHTFKSELMLMSDCSHSKYLKQQNMTSPPKPY